MPLYLYRCRSCDLEAEYLQKLSDAPLETCEVCGGKLEKQMTSAAFQLKGGGWYADGYAKPGKGSGSSSKSSSSSDSSSSSKKSTSSKATG